MARQQVDVAFSNKKISKKNYIPPKDFYDGKLNRPTKVITGSVIKDDINKSFFPLSLVFLFLSLYNLFLSKRCWETWVERSDDIMNYLIVLVAIFGVIACALTGVFGILSCETNDCRDEIYGLAIARLKHVAVLVGALAGSGVGAVCALFN